MRDISVGLKRKMVALLVTAVLINQDVTLLQFRSFSPLFCYKLLPTMNIFPSVKIKLPIRLCSSNLFCYTCLPATLLMCDRTTLCVVELLYRSAFFHYEVNFFVCLLLFKHQHNISLYLTCEVSFLRDIPIYSNYFCGNLEIFFFFLVIFVGIICFFLS
jgi:hypothetical protein